MCDPRGYTQSQSQSWNRLLFHFFKHSTFANYWSWNFHCPRPPLLSISNLLPCHSAFCLLGREEYSILLLSRLSGQFFEDSRSGECYLGQIPCQQQFLNCFQSIFMLCIICWSSIQLLLSHWVRANAYPSICFLRNTFIDADVKTISFGGTYRGCRRQQINILFCCSVLFCSRTEPIWFLTCQRVFIPSMSNSDPLSWSPYTMTAAI